MLLLAYMNTDTFIASLIEFQDKEGLNNQEFARKLHISDSYLSRIKHGLRKPGIKLYQCVAITFPDLKPLVDAEIYGKTNYKHTEIPVRKTYLTKFLEAFK